MRKLAFSIFLIALILSACQERPVYHNKHFPDQQIWAYGDAVKLDFKIRDTTKIYDMSLIVEHSTDYPWENLYVKMYNVFPNGDTTSRPLSLELADKTGKWQGECNGAVCKAVIDIQKHVFFPQTGDYHVWVEQYMRQDSVPGIKSIDLALYRAEVKED